MHMYIAGHEYSLSNLQFAASLEPSNERVREKLQEVSDQRSTRRCTVCSLHCSTGQWPWQSS